MAPRWAYAALAAGVVAFSTSGVMMKLCAAHPVTIAAWVRGLSLAYLLGALGASARRRAVGDLRHAASIGMLGGVAFGIHSLAFIAGMKLTAVTVVLLLGAVNPAVVGAAGALLFGERLGGRQVAWTAVAMIAAAAVVLAQDAGGETPWLGNAAATCAALFYCAYLLVSRHARLVRGIGVLAYQTAATATSFALALGVALAAGVPLTPPAPSDYLYLAAIGLVPATLGHISVNWSLRHVAAHQAAIALLAVPVLGGLWAHLLVAERLGPGQLLAGVAVLAAIPGAIRPSAPPADAAGLVAVPADADR